MSIEPSDPTQSGTELGILGHGPVTLSRNELVSLCAKAARGGGMAWGIAEEAGFACGWLAERGVDGAAALLAHLDWIGPRDWSEMCPTMTGAGWQAAGQGVLCPLAVGTALSDQAHVIGADLSAGGLTIARLGHPVLCLPFVAVLAEHTGHAIRVSWGDLAVLVAAEGQIVGDIATLANLSDASVVLSVGAPVPGGAFTGVSGCAPATIAALDAYAMRMTVPPSETSRADAGAGESDND